MLYRVKGEVTEEGITWIWNSITNKEELCRGLVSKTYFLEATNFQKATTKAKKILDTVREIREFSGEIVYE